MEIVVLDHPKCKVLWRPMPAQVAAVEAATSPPPSPSLRHTMRKLFLRDDASASEATDGERLE